MRQLINADPYGHARDAYDNRRAAIRQEQEDAYMQREREDDRAFERSYADAYAGNDFERAEGIAAKHGNVQGVAAARSAGQQHTQQQREEAVREVLPYYRELQRIGETNDANAYTDWRRRVLASVQDNPELAGWAQQNIPEVYNPQVQGAVLARIEGILTNIMPPADIARMLRGNAGTDWRPATPEELRGFRPGSVVDVNTQTGERIVRQNPSAPRAQDEGPPPPPAGYVIVR